MRIHRRGEMSLTLLNTSLHLLFFIFIISPPPHTLTQLPYSWRVKKQQHIQHSRLLHKYMYNDVPFSTQPALYTVANRNNSEKGKSSQHNKKNIIGSAQKNYSMLLRLGRDERISIICEKNMMISSLSRIQGERVLRTKSEINLLIISPQTHSL